MGKKYIKPEEREKYERAGYKVYEGPRKGTYIITGEGKKEKTKKEKGGTIHTKLKNVVDWAVQVNKQPDTPETRRALLKLQSLRKGSMAQEATGNIDDRIREMKQIKGESLNNNRTFVIKFRDGSVAYGKTFANKEELKKMFEWASEAMTRDLYHVPANCYILGRLYRDFVKNEEYKERLPRVNLARVKGKPMVLTEEVYGLFGDKYKKPVEFKKDVVEDFIIAGIMTGLRDMHMRNVFIDPEGYILPFDFDFMSENRFFSAVGVLDYLCIAQDEESLQIPKVDAADVVERLQKVVSELKYGEYRKIISNYISEMKEYFDYSENDWALIEEKFVKHFLNIIDVLDLYDADAIDVEDVLISLGAGYMGEDDIKKKVFRSKVEKSEKDIPIQYRVYIKPEEEKKYKEKGIEIHRGPRGGLYIDIRDIDEEGKVETLDFENPMNRMAVFEVAETADRNIVHKIGHAVFLFSTYRKKESVDIQAIGDIYYKANLAGIHSDAAKKNIKEAERLSEDDIGLPNHTNIIDVYEYPDGSRRFVKYYELIRDFFIGYVESRIWDRICDDTQRVYARIDNYDPELGVGLGQRELFGYEIEFLENYVKETEDFFVSYLKQLIDSGVWKPTEATVDDFIKAQVMGLEDLNDHNFLISFKDGHIMFYDFEYVFSGANDGARIAHFLGHSLGMDDEQLGQRFVDMWKKYKPIILQTVQDSIEELKKLGFDGDGSIWQKWVKEVDSKIQQYEGDYAGLWQDMIRNSAEWSVLELF